jgi:hypothetical protein
MFGDNLRHTHTHTHTHTLKQINTSARDSTALHCTDLDCFVIDERINHFGRGLVLQSIHVLAKLCPVQKNEKRKDRKRQKKKKKKKKKEKEKKKRKKNQGNEGRTEK